MLKLVKTQTIKSVGDVAKCSEKFNVLRLSFVPDVVDSHVFFGDLRFVLDSSFYCGDLRPYVAIQQYLLWDRTRLASYESAYCLMNYYNEYFEHKYLSSIYLYFPETKDVELRFLQNDDVVGFTLNCEFIFDDNFHLFDNIGLISNEVEIKQGIQNFNLSPNSFYYVVSSFQENSAGTDRIYVNEVKSLVVDGVSFVPTELVSDWVLSSSFQPPFSALVIDSYLLPVPKGSKNLSVFAGSYPNVDLFKLNLK